LCNLVSNKKAEIMKDQTKIIAALLVGAAAGAALGLLLAPDSGEGLRGDIAEYVNDLVSSAKNKAQSTVDDLKEYSNNAVDRAKSKFNGGVEDAKEYGSNGVNEAKSKVKATANDLNDSIQQA
jgi:gas vesicle protein